MIRLVPKWMRDWHLVPDWKRCLHWGSIHWNLAGIGFNVLSAAMLKGITVSMTLVGFIPLGWLPAIATGICILALVARVVKKGAPADGEAEADN